MDFLTSLFFESLLLLGLFSFVLFAGVLLGRRYLESDVIRRRSIPMALGLIATLFIVQSLVVTQRERVRAQLGAFVGAFVAEDAAAAGAIISQNFDSEGMDREDILQHLRGWFEMIDVRDPRYSRRDITIDGTGATLHLAVSATVSIRGDTGQTHFGVWMIDWRLEDGAWRITGLRPVSINMQPITSLNQLRGATGR